MKNYISHNCRCNFEIVIQIKSRITINANVRGSYNVQDNVWNPIFIYEYKHMNI